MVTSLTKETITTVYTVQVRLRIVVAHVRTATAATIVYNNLIKRFALEILPRDQPTRVLYSGRRLICFSLN